MALAYVGVHVENFACEIPKAQNVVTLCSIDRKLAIFESITRLKFDNTLTVHEDVEMRTKLAIGIRTRLISKRSMTASCNSRNVPV